MWLTGTPAELDAAVAVLTAAAYVTQVSDRHPLAGADAGRHRVFLRLALTTTTATADTPAARRPGPAAADRGGALIDLDTARATRRPTARKENRGA
ncbi:hypothetical protein [Micromonospora sp. NBRC 110038]|uniref:hypothetical protein n=1 Tax=Micromonospora sp. NBRC 110038 TaxID=1550034 RepID=UPI001E36F400|nr:hypothetical protein [Micromonospora sp. NBRC 110038]